MRLKIDADCIEESCLDPAHVEYPLTLFNFAAVLEFVFVLFDLALANLEDAFCLYMSQL